MHVACSSFIVIGHYAEV